MVSIESETIRACTVELVEGISPCVVSVANGLVAEGVIPSKMVDRMLLSINKQACASELVGTVRDQAKNFPRKFTLFVKVLKREPSLSDVVDLLSNTLASKWPAPSPRPPRPPIHHC